MNFNVCEFVSDLHDSIITRALKMQFLRWVGYSSLDTLMSVAIRATVSPTTRDDAAERYRAEYMLAWALDTLPQTFDLLVRNSATGEWRSVPTSKQEWLVDTLNSVWNFRGLGLAQQDNAMPGRAAAEAVEYLRKLGFGEGVAEGQKRRATKDEARAMRNVENKSAIFARVLASIKHPAVDSDCVRVDVRTAAGYIGRVIAKLESWGNGAARRAVATRNKVWAAEAGAEATEWASVIRLAEQSLEDVQTRADENVGYLDGENTAADDAAALDIEAAFARALNG